MSNLLETVGWTEAEINDFMVRGYQEATGMDCELIDDDTMEIYVAERIPTDDGRKWVMPMLVECKPFTQSLDSLRLFHKALGARDIANLCHEVEVHTGHHLDDILLLEPLDLACLTILAMGLGR